MNNSGRAVKLLLRKIKPDQIWVIQDDLDLPLGKMKISSNRGAGGHHGIESIIKEIGTNNFSRFRLGIKTKHSSPSETFVIQKFKLREKLAVSKMIQEAIFAIDLAITEGLTMAIQKYNQKNSS
jgi:PTH1 family peptidyl-tRNA hydrolase